MGKIEELMKKFTGFLSRWMLFIYIAALAVAVGFETTGYFLSGAPTTIIYSVLLLFHLTMSLSKAIEIRRDRDWDIKSDKFIDMIRSRKLEELIVDENPHMDFELDRVLKNRKGYEHKTSGDRLTRFFQELFIPRLIDYKKIIRSVKERAGSSLTAATVFIALDSVSIAAMTILSGTLFMKRNLPVLIGVIFLILLFKIIALRCIEKFYTTHKDVEYYMSKMYIEESKCLELEQYLKINNSRGAARAIRSLKSPSSFPRF